MKINEDCEREKKQQITTVPKFHKEKNKTKQNLTMQGQPFNNEQNKNLTIIGSNSLLYPTIKSFLFCFVFL